nr:alpha-L-fucosidase [Niabella ginsengisoli]
MWGNTAAQEPTNVQWFKDAKFGMFIHWGLYSDYAGNWKGKNYYGSGEWIMQRGKIPIKEYRKITKTFNPVDFNADEWTQIAADAGMKYMVITAKHHDGFAMYDSKVSDFNIVKATPYKKDPMKALSAAARKKVFSSDFIIRSFRIGTSLTEEITVGTLTNPKRLSTILSSKSNTPAKRITYQLWATRHHLV